MTNLNTKQSAIKVTEEDKKGKVLKTEGIYALVEVSKDKAKWVTLKA